MIEVAVLEVRELTKKFAGSIGLTDISFVAEQPEVLAILGPNGSGKTTLLNLLGGSLRPDRGTVLWNDRNLEAAPAWKRASLGIARSFQEIKLAWRLSVLENIQLALSASTRSSLWNGLIHPWDTTRIEKALKETALKFLRGTPLETLANQEARNLSFGQQKLLGVLCCRASNGKLLLLDEPVSGVAGGLREQILALVMECRTGGGLVLLVEHDLEAARRVANRFLVLNEGSVLSHGSWEDVASSVRRLLT